MLQGKNIILGITGSIAAYKAAFLTRLLKREGAQIKIILTPYGKEFITPVTLATLSGNTVLTDFFHHDDGAWNSHVDLGIWADIMLIAPATANTIAKMAGGIADNLLLTTYLSAKCPVVVAPAMDLDMFRHPATLKNLETLKSFGNLIIEPTTGELASGLEGKGRMEEPEKIVAWLEDYFKKKSRFNGKRVLITAGPTYEKIDPVRFIGNHSSGKMGYALAKTFADEGACVDLVSGPVNLNFTHKNVTIHPVVSAGEMDQQASALFPSADIVVFAAAVADYRPVRQENSKIKRTGENLTITLTPNTDIAAKLGGQRKCGQILIGFALESDNALANASKKLAAKNLDFIVLNQLNDPGSGFDVDTNRIIIIGKDNNQKKFELKSKQDVATDIADEIYNLMTHG
ncbi:MAG: bifunctional phosphopantothenoylcysteine decarboxylase/phosphopantothenate--cysteine ligase CoaBC [Bacteroidales bacterium]|nr:bifunctional phosphopantothenoylcysteine decarboxylase/phosphopantothenate--cysteine ligase CoaBC [Bacteroidales bacterium]